MKGEFSLSPRKGSLVSEDRLSGSLQRESSPAKDFKIQMKLTKYILNFSESKAEVQQVPGNVFPSKHI